MNNRAPFLSKQFHFIGIGGIGMSALAHMLLQKKIAVKGSDSASSYLTQALKEGGAEIFSSHSAKNICEGHAVVYSSAISEDNIELISAKNQKNVLFHRSELLNLLAKEQKMIAIAGTHGKTTATALLAWVLDSAKQMPSYYIGGVVPHFTTHGKLGSGEYFVAEADESDGTFNSYTPYSAIVTNIDCDHMDYFKSEEALCSAFAEFIQNVQNKKLIFWNGDDLRLKKICAAQGCSVGFSPSLDCCITECTQKGWKSFFSLQYQGQSYSNIAVNLTGKHNVWHAAAIFALAITLRVDENDIRLALESFEGVGRRCEKKGHISEILVIDDYAHHPLAVKKTLQAIREAIGERKLIAVYQPHRYSRTLDTLGQWGDVFNAADEVYITEIFAASEKPCGVTEKAIIEEVDRQGLTLCQFVPRNNAAAVIAQKARPHDVIVSMGAGDITNLYKELKKIWELNPPKPLKVALITGGESGEHEIALLSASHFLEGLSQPHYETSLFTITKNGYWLEGEKAQALYKGLPFDEPAKKISSEILYSLEQSEVLLPIFHGPKGEDGAIQGFFELLGKAYVGCQMRAAAICMDKGLVKKLAIQAEVPTLKFLECSKFEWIQRPEAFFQKVCNELTFPLFIKPAHCGSSLGVIKVEKEEDFSQAMNDSLCHDHLVTVEVAAPKNFREIEFAVLGNEIITVFPPGEILSGGKVYDYESKYSNNGFATSCAPLGIDESVIEQGKKLAEIIYRACRCTGFTRVDFFLDENSHWYLNELNPIPGFTAISLYPKLAAQAGLKIGSLVNSLIALALHNHSYKKTKLEVARQKVLC